jgi:leucyl aminopeptidase
MDSFGFSTEAAESELLLIKDVSQIDLFQQSSSIELKKGTVSFLGEPFHHWIFIADQKDSFFQFGGLPKALPSGVFKIQAQDFDIQDIYLGWGLGYYQFTQYKTLPRVSFAKILVETPCLVKDQLLAIYRTRDLINTPPNDMGPYEFKEYAKSLFPTLKVHETHQDWPTVFAVGKGSDRPSYVLEIDWCHEDPKFSLGLAGKGICFDTGGYNLKTGNGMNLMKKDMAGAAQALSLTKWIIDANLPIKLKTIIPLAENSVSGKAYRPSDVIKTKKGTTVEVGDTDAEGRLVLCDALYALSLENPDLIVDFATLTGAARVALGPDLPAVFSNDDGIAKDLVSISNDIHDRLWHMPLFRGYRDSISSKIADLNNVSSMSYGGAITAALFLNEFVPASIPWVHIDFMGWNLTSKPGCPEGGESMGMRSVFEFLKRRAYHGLS